MIPRPLLILLLVLNAVVLLGLLWPEGAPPFASAVNIAVAIGNVIVLFLLVARRRV